MNYRFSLEEWSGDKPGGNKTICPQCGKRTFVRYVDTHTGEYLGDIVGRCERVNNCRYHLTPREFFDGLSEGDKKRLLQDWRDFPAKTEPLPAKRAIQFLDDDCVGRYKSGQSRLELFLRRRFPDKGEQISAVLEKYCVGCDERGRTVFWQIDADGHLRAGKIISYKQETGHRDKAEHPPVSWVHSRLQKEGVLLSSWKPTQTLFGAHLLAGNTVKSVCIVESEKTAIVSALLLPDFIWVATGGMQNLRLQSCECLKGRNVIVYPDLGAYYEWEAKISSISARVGFSASVSDLLEGIASPEEKLQGLDIADYLLAQSGTMQ